MTLLSKINRDFGELENLFAQLRLDIIVADNTTCTDELKQIKTNQSAKSRAKRKGNVKTAISKSLLIALLQEYKGEATE